MLDQGAENREQVGAGLHLIQHNEAREFFQRQFSILKTQLVSG